MKDNGNKTIFAIPAAGLSRRLGRNKLFLKDRKDRYLFERKIEDALKLKMEAVVVVRHKDKEALDKQLKKIKNLKLKEQTTILVNTSGSSELSSSIMIILKHASQKNASNLIISPADSLPPGITNLKRILLMNKKHSGKKIIFPEKCGEKGFLTLIPALHFKRVSKGLKNGVRGFISTNPDISRGYTTRSFLLFTNINHPRELSLL